jgi:hypothetical protein
MPSESDWERAQETQSELVLPQLLHAAGISDRASEPIDAFARRAVATMQRSTATTLIVDMRNSIGGNSYLYPPLFRAIAGFAALPGDRAVYVLIGNGPVSAGQNLATDLDRLLDVTFIGTPTGQAPSFYADPAIMHLPYSGITVRVAGARWMPSRPGDRRTAIAPDIPVATTGADYAAGRDPVMDVVGELISRRAGGTRGRP